jgi:hypothetical protein
MLKFLTEKLGQLDFAITCLEFTLPLVDISIEQPINIFSSKYLFIRIIVFDLNIFISIKRKFVNLIIVTIGFI